MLSKSANLSGDVCSTLFGSTILTLKAVDVWICVLMSIVVVGLFTFFYHKLFAITFDADFARATGVPAGAYDVLIAVVTAVVIVLAMNLVGSLLTSALIVFPALSAMQAFKKLPAGRHLLGGDLRACAVLGIFISILAVSTIVAADVFLSGVLHARKNHEGKHMKRIANRYPALLSAGDDVLSKKKNLCRWLPRFEHSFTFFIHANPNADSLRLS